TLLLADDGLSFVVLPDLDLGLRAEAENQVRPQLQQALKEPLVLHLWFVPRAHGHALPLAVVVTGHAVEDLVVPVEQPTFAGVLVRRAVDDDDRIASLVRLDDRLEVSPRAERRRQVAVIEPEQVGVS